MDRRNFFRRATREVGTRTVAALDTWARQHASRWVRPPFALDELEFLLACTRCNACIEACPTGVIFPLAPHAGAQVAGTPALDLLHKACQLCADWPCLQACEPGALKYPGTKKKKRRILPRLARLRIDPAICLPYQGPECGACRDSCPVRDALLWERERPRIDPARCTGCAQCREACVVEPKAITVGSWHTS